MMEVQKNIRARLLRSQEWKARDFFQTINYNGAALWLVFSLSFSPFLSSNSSLSLSLSLSHTHTHYFLSFCSLTCSLSLSLCSFRFPSLILSPFPFFCFFHLFLSPLSLSYYLSPFLTHSISP
jgi:hypothetical protein